MMSRVGCMVTGSLSRDVFKRRTSTGSELFSLLVCLDANKFVLLSFFSPLKTIYSRVSTKPLPNDAKSSLPVDVRRSKTLLLKLPNKPFLFPLKSDYSSPKTMLSKTTSSRQKNTIQKRPESTEMQIKNWAAIFRL